MIFRFGTVIKRVTMRQIADFFSYMKKSGRKVRKPFLLITRKNKRDIPIYPPKSHWITIPVLGLIILLILGISPFFRPRAVQGAYSTSTTDADNNNHLASDSVNDTYFYDRTQDSDVGTEQKLGVDPNWANGVSRKSFALDFDGSNDEASIASNSSLQATDTTDLTLEAWFNRESFASDHVILAKRPGITAAEVGYIVYIDDSDDKIHFEISDGTDEYELASSSTFTTSGWHHFAVVWDQDSAANSEIFIDGVDDNATDTGTIGNIGDTTNLHNFRIGSESDSASFFDGKLDEIRVSTTPRYYANFSPLRRLTEDMSTAGLWHFDEGGTDQTLLDASQNGNSLTRGLSGSASSDDPTWVTGPNAILDGFDGAKSQTGYQTGAGNITLGSSSSVTNDKEYEMRITNSNGIKLDGTDDYVDVGDQANLYIAGSFTIEAWIKPTSLGTTQGIMGDALASGASNNFVLWITGGSVAECWWENPTGTSPKATATTVLQNNRWYHIACSWDGTTRRIFVDGKLEGTNNTAESRASDVGANFTIGRAGSYPFLHFAGYIDEARVSSSARYLGDFTPARRFASDGSTQGLWHFEDATGTSATDSSSNGYNGTFKNGDSNSPAADGTTNGPIWDEGIGTSRDQGGAYTIGEVFYQWRDLDGAGSAGSWSTRAQVPTTNTQLASTGVYVKFNPDGMYSKADIYRVHSWGIEALSTSAPARGALNSFPEKANLIASNGGLDIIDASTNKLWMRFPKASSNLIGSNNTLQVTARNGTVYVASADGLTEVRFYDDAGLRYTSSGNSLYTDGFIADRNDALGYNSASGNAVISTTVNDVSVTTIGSAPPKQDVAVAASTGMTVIQNTTGNEVNSRSSGTAVNYSKNSSDAYTDVVITGSGNLYGVNSTVGGFDRYDSVDSDSSNQTTSSDRSYSTSSIPALRSNTINDISVTTTTSTADQASNSVAVAHNLGVDVIQEHATQSSGTIRYYTRTGSTGSSNWSSKNFGGAMLFDGSDDYISKGSLTGGSAIKTVEFWVKPTTTTTEFVDLNGSAYISASSGTISATGFTSPTIYVNGVVSSTLTANTWQHIAVTTNTGVNASAYNVGKRSSSYFSGVIDEIRISDSVRYATTFTPSPSPFTTDSNTVLLWHLDERTGQTAYDSGSAATANNGTLGANGSIASDDPFFISPALAGSADKATAVGLHKSGDTGRALSFDGGDFVDVGDQSNLYIPGSFTIEAWIKPTVGALQFVMGDAVSSGATNNFVFEIQATGLTACWWENPTGTVNKALGTTTLTTGVWYHVACSWDGTTRRIFVNGILEGTNSVAQTRSPDAGGNFRIGRAGDYSSFTYTGSVDEVRVSNSSRYTENFLPQRRFQPDNNTMGLWHFDEGTGQEAKDSSTNNYTGTYGASASPGSDDPSQVTASAANLGADFMWVGTNDSSADDGAISDISLATDKQITAYDTSNSGLPDKDISAVSLGAGGLALVGTADNGAWNPGLAGIVVDDTASSPATLKNPVRGKGGTMRVKNGTVRIKPN